MVDMQLSQVHSKPNVVETEGAASHRPFPIEEPICDDQGDQD